jgi:hypothetical protein
VLAACRGFDASAVNARPSAEAQARAAVGLAGGVLFVALAVHAA